MALEWKTTEVKTESGSAKVTHWAKHDPRAIFDAVSAKSVGYAPNAVPPITRHTFGRHLLAVRRCNPNGLRDGMNEYLPPSEIFANLQELVAAGHAFVEMPVAFIERPKKPSLLVTLWKKDSQALGSRDVGSSGAGYLADKAIPRAKRVAVSLEFVRQLAKLHALGFVLVHSASRNVVRNVNGSVQLIDPTILRRQNAKFNSGRDLDTALSSILTGLKITDVKESHKVHDALIYAYRSALENSKSIVRKLPTPRKGDNT